VNIFYKRTSTIEGKYAANSKYKDFLPEEELMP
jgi:hypothetical protein